MVLCHGQVFICLCEFGSCKSLDSVISGIRFPQKSLYAEMPFSSLSAEDKLWACYLHACVKQVQNEQLTNTSLRERFGLKPSSSGSASRLIKEAVTLTLIKPLDPDTAPRYMRYIPYWA